jgi:hypothetical protein
MATYYVTKVRKETVTKDGASHRHLIGVQTGDGSYYTNQQVVDSIAATNDWYTDVFGQPKARIKKLEYCPDRSCMHKPYITTEADKTANNNLENMPEG